MEDARTLVGEARRQIPECLGPDEWCVALSAAAHWMGLHSEHVNSLNVFPVPDGDTGVNMYLTLKAAAEACAAARDQLSLGERAERAAKAALLAARGNSGVILAQFLIGMAETFNGAACAEGGLLARAFRAAAEESYSVLLQPVEGTILTVMRRAAEAAERAAEGGGDVGLVLRSSLDAAQQAVADTPRLLAILAEAGVVDAGGEGFRLMLQGMIYGLEGRSLPELDLSQMAAGHVSMPGPERSTSSFCTTVTLKATGPAAPQLRESLRQLGDSVVVVSNSNFIKVHVHTVEPAHVLDWLSGKGEIQEVKVDRIVEFTSTVAPRLYPPNRQVDLVAVAEGEGFAELFSRLGARVVEAIDLSPTVEDLLRAMEGSAAHAVVVLPNDPNLFSVARQAARLSRKKVEVMDVRTPQEGVAAAIAFSPDVELEENLRNMRAAASGVVSVKVAQATRDARVAGVMVRAGQFMALVRGDGVGVGDTLREAVEGAIMGLKRRDFSLATLYYGHQLSSEQLEDVVAGLKALLPDTEVQVDWGGQRQSLLLISLEA